MTIRDLAKLIGEKIRLKELTPTESIQDQEEFRKWSIGLSAFLNLTIGSPPSDKEIENIRRQWDDSTAINYNKCYTNLHLEHMKKRDELIAQYGIEYLEECRTFYLGSNKDKNDNNEKRKILV